MDKQPIFSGRVRHPDNLQPAIDALTDRGRKYLEQLRRGGKVTPQMLARAADYERGER